MQSKMISFVLAIACIVLTLIIAVSNLRLRSSSVPRVPTLLAGYDNGLLYALNSRAFLARCQKRYGPVYRISLGYRQLLVVTAGSTIKSVLAASSDLLHYDFNHKELLHLVAGVTNNVDYLYHIMVQELFPLIDKTLSPRSLAQNTGSFGLVLLSQIKEFVQNQSGPISITRLTNEPLYATTNLVLFGPAFPVGTYEDFCILDKSMPYRFSRTLFWPFPSDAARRRLLKVLSTYLQRDVGTHEKDKISSAFTKVFRDNKIQSMEEGAKLMLDLLWGIHSNTLNNSLFLLSFLLHDSDGLLRVREEIDKAVEKFGGLEALLEAGPDALDDPSFGLLTSAVMETLRLTALTVGMRQAIRDFDLQAGDRVIPIEKGEYIFEDVYTSHMDSSVYPNPKSFVVDRFAQQPYRRKRLQTEQYLFHSLGGGKHICRGRWLAIYQIKVLMIILLHVFDFSPSEENSAKWSMPRIHPRSVGMTHIEDVIFTRLSPRQVKVGETER